MSKKKKVFIPYNKTPLMIKEILGEETYNMMEECMQNYKHNPNYIILTSAKGMEMMKKVLKERNGK